jgi:acetylornithine aminotransferase/acetylornithine/N-succinyldiaminopimelate aminotransferase
MTYGDHLFVNYRPAGISFSHGSGARLYTRDGREILDFIAGIATCSLGHAHPRLVAALQDQVSRYLHVSNLFQIEEQDQAANALIEAAQAHLPEAERSAPEALSRVFFCNSGAEANEAAIKLARKTAWRTSGPEAEKFEIVVTHNGFHGRTMGALAATGTAKYHEGFAPLPGGFTFVPFNDLAAAEKVMSDRVCAVLIEPVQGEGGVNVGTREYLQGLQSLCRKFGALFIVDEVQTGPARLGGDMFAFQKFGLQPDAVVLAKGLGSGVPVGAVMARDSVALNLQPGDHGSTFGGNALATRAVKTVLDVIHEEGLVERATEAGERLAAGILGLGLPAVVAVRGEGLMRAVELEIEAGPVAAECLARGLLVNAVRPTAIRLLPPLVVSDAEIDAAVEILGAAIAAVAKPAQAEHKQSA